MDAATLSDVLRGKLELQLKRPTYSVAASPEGRFVLVHIVKGNRYIGMRVAVAHVSQARHDLVSEIVDSLVDRAHEEL